MFNTANSIKTEEDVDMSSKILDLSIRRDSINPIETSPRSNEYRKRSPSINPIGYKNQINSSRSYTDPYASFSATKYWVENSPSPYNREFQDNQSSYMSPQNVPAAPTLHGYSQNSHYVPIIYGHDGQSGSLKACRPNPLSIVTNPVSDETYEEFKERKQLSIQDTNGGWTNPNMRRIISQSKSRTETSDNTDNASGNCNNSDSSNSQFVKDEAYYEKRKKNNEAAKRSRDRRKHKEKVLSDRVQFLKSQNLALFLEMKHRNALIAKLKMELAVY